MIDEQGKIRWWTRLHLLTWAPSRIIAIVVVALLLASLVVLLNQNPGEAALTLVRVFTQWQVLGFALLIVFGPKIGAAINLLLMDRDLKARYRDAEFQATQQPSLQSSTATPIVA